MKQKLIQSQKDTVLNHTGSGKPSFKKFHQSIKGKKDEMKIVYSIDDLLHDSEKGGAKVWARFMVLRQIWCKITVLKQPV